MPLYQRNRRGLMVSIRKEASDLEILKLAVSHRMVTRNIIRALQKKEVYVEKDQDRIEVFDARDPGGMPVLSLERVPGSNPPAGNKLTPEARKFISDTIRREIKAGYPRRVAHAIGYSQARRARFKVPVKNPPNRGRIMVGDRLTRIVTTNEVFAARHPGGMGKIWGLSDGSILLSGMFARAPKGSVKEIWYVDVAKSKAEGLKSPARPWRHVFHQRVPLMKAQGGLLMKAQGRRLWEVR